MTYKKQSSNDGNRTHAPLVSWFLRNSTSLPLIISIMRARYLIYFTQQLLFELKKQNCAKVTIANRYTCLLEPSGRPSDI